MPKEKGRCHLRNAAEIYRPHGGSRWNSDPTDDADTANALIPDPDCRHHPDRTDLKIYKRAFSCYEAGNHLRCAYQVTVENVGPGAYHGDIVVHETIPAATTPTFSGGWSCLGAGTDYTCTFNNAHLPVPGGTKSFIVRLDFSKADAKEMHCRVRNHVKITEAPGGSTKNTDPNNDTADAVGTVPAHFCQDDPKTNLRITKSASPLYCSQSGNDWWCSYLIQVQNTGPGTYNGPIRVEEALPGSPVDAQWTAGWTCNGLGGGGGGAICTHPAVSLPKDGILSLHLRVKFAGSLVKEKQCRMVNVAKIVTAAPGTDKNTNPGDDIAGATAFVPAWFCRTPPPEPTDLELTKYGAQPKCNVTDGGKWRCPYIMIIKNVGGADYHGKIVVKDWLPAAASGATMQEQGGVWNCTGNAPQIICTHPVTTIKPAQQKTLSVYVFVDPKSYHSCSLLNHAKILQAPGGTTQNTSAANDQSSATLEFPPLLVGDQSFCYSPEPIKPCPPGFHWTGNRCDRGGLVPPPPRECPEGYVGNYPDCRKIEDPGCTGGRVRDDGQCVCPRGKHWNGERCVRRDCPEGTRGIYPHCRKVIIDPPRCTGGRVRDGKSRTGA